LWERAGEAVEDIARHLAVGLDFVAQHADGDTVGHQLALFHVSFGLHPQRGLVAHLVAEQIAGRDMQQTIFFDQESGLGAFAGPGGSEENQRNHTAPGIYVRWLKSLSADKDTAEFRDFCVFPQGNSGFL
jgi:hypothetical protein